MTDRVRHTLRFLERSGNSMLAWACRFFSFLSFQDFGAIIGLSLLGYGLYLIRPPYAFITVGAIVFTLSVWNNLRGH